MIFNDSKYDELYRKGGYDDVTDIVLSDDDFDEFVDQTLPQKSINRKYPKEFAVYCEMLHQYKKYFTKAKLVNKFKVEIHVINEWLDPYMTERGLRFKERGRMVRFQMNGEEE